MGEIKDSEAYKSLKVLFGKYKEFSFKAISQIPYGSVGRWAAFSDGRVEEALKGKRGIWESVKDAYALWILGIFFSILAFWYVAFLLGGMLLGAAALIAAMGLLADWAWTIGIIAAIILGMLIAPGAFLLARSAFYHLVLKLFRAKGSFSDTVSVMVLASAAHLVLMIPLYFAYAIIIGYILGPLAYAVTIYAYFLQYRGMRHVHKMESKDAAVATIAAIVLEIGLYAAVYIGFYIAMLALQAGLAGQ